MIKRIAILTVLLVYIILQSYATDSIKDIFIIQEVSPKKALEGQPVKVSYKLYTQKDIIQIHEMKFPAFDGCWIDVTRTDSTVLPIKEEYNNVLYSTYLLQEFTIYPLRSGDLVIDGFSLDFEYRKETGRKEKSFFGEIDVFENKRDTLYVDAETIHVNVSPDNNLKEFEYNHARSSHKPEKILKEKSDIVLAIDISGSMNAEDFKPNRQEATKNVIKLFRNKLPKAKTGLVLFSGKSYPQTSNINKLTTNPNYSKMVSPDAFEDGTAIGMGLIGSINLLNNSENSPKAIVLVTDGTNTMGNISPLTASDIARQKGISIYIIGIGAKGKVPFPFLTPTGKQFMDMETQIDEVTLEKMASTTGGKYFRAVDDKSFSKATNDIIKLLPEIKQPDMNKDYEYINPENIEYILDIFK